jgi:putative membrane protein
MRFQFQQALRAAILLAFSGLIFQLHLTGEIAKYINIKYAAFSQVASVLFMFLFFIQVRRIWTERRKHYHDCHQEGCGHDHGLSSGWSWKTVVTYTILIIPLLTGFFLPAKTLDASIAAKKGLMYRPSSTEQLPNELPATEQGSTGQIAADHNPSDDDVDNGNNGTDDSLVYFDDLYKETIDELLKQDTISMKEEKFASYADAITLYPDLFKGKSIQLKGFVYKEEGMNKDELVVGRFIITHCIADAGLIGFMVKMDEAPGLESDTWIEIEGVLDMTKYGDFDMPVIKVSSWNTVNAPDDPYVYP